MADYCFNRVRVSGELGDVRRLVEQVRSAQSAFDFDRVLPFPPELEGITKRFLPDGSQSVSVGEHGASEAVETQRLVATYGYSNWYDWEMANWGTCSNALAPVCHLEAEEDEGFAQYEFDTKWRPAVGIYQELSRRFPSLSIFWFFDVPASQEAGYLKAVGLFSP